MKTQGQRKYLNTSSREEEGKKNQRNEIKKIEVRDPGED